MTFSNFPNPFFGSDLAAQQCNVGTPPGLLGGQQANPGSHHSVYEPYPGAVRLADSFPIGEFERRQQEMQRLQGNLAMDRLNRAYAQLPPRPQSIDELAGYLQELPGCDAPRYQPIPQPAPNKVLLLLE